MGSWHLVGWFAAHLAILLVLLVCPMAVARARGCTGETCLLLLGMAVPGVLGFATFGVYLADRSAGRAFGVGLVAVALVMALWVFPRPDVRRGVWAVAARPLALYSTVSAGALSLGFLYGGTRGGAEIAENRYLAGLPIDNALPDFLAQQLLRAPRPLPHYLVGASQWTGSDRPPMETAYYLLDDAVIHRSHDYLHFEIVGVLLQSFWVLGLWALLRALRVPGRLAAAAVAVVACSGFTLLNSFFTWPKLLPGGYLLAVAAVLLTAEFAQVRRSRLLAVATGACFGCAMLGHPGSIFVAIALVATLLLLRQLPARRLTLWGGAPAVLLYAPWIAYQRWYNPPGDDLDRLQLANIPVGGSTGSLAHAVIEVYRRTAATTVWHNKITNLTTPFDHTWSYYGQVWELLTHSPASGAGLAAASVLRGDTFFSMVPMLGLMAFGPVALVMRLLLGVVLHRGRPPAGPPGAGRFVVRAYLCLAINLVLWAAVLFGPAATVIHQGSYFVPLLAFAAGALSWWLVSPQLLMVAVVLQSILGVYLYALPPPQVGAGQVYRSSHAAPGAVAVAAVAGLLFLASVLWAARVGAREPARTAVGESAIRGFVPGPRQDPDKAAPASRDPQRRTGRHAAPARR